MWEHLKKPGSVRSWAAFAGGAAFTVAEYALSQWMQPARSVLDRRKPPSHALPLYCIPRFYAVLNSWPWILVVFLVFAGLSFLKRNKADGWAYALVEGVALIGILPDGRALLW